VVLVLLFAVALALQTSSAAANPVMHWSPSQRIVPSAETSFGGAQDISCADANLCVAVGREGRFLSSTEPAGGIEAWTETQIGGPKYTDLTAVSCPAEDFCAAVDEAGKVFVSADPGQGAWVVKAIGDGDPLTDVSCSSGSFCVAGDQSGDVFVSEDPANTSVSWEATELDAEDEITGISCPSASLCVAVAEEDVFTSTDPGAGVWSATGLENFRDVSCPSVSFCAAATFTGVFVSDEPDGDASAWTESPGGPSSAEEISCPTEDFCAAMDYLAHVSTSGDPAGANPEWEEAALRPESAVVTGLSCPSSGFCAAVLESGAIFTSADPAGGVDAWDFTATEGDDRGLSSADCPSASLCLVAGPHGTLYTSTEPTVPGSWTGERITDGRIDQVECKTEEWCIARVYNRTLLYSTDPTGGPAAWNSVSIPFALDVACPEYFFCAAVDGSDEVQMSGEPLAGAGTWSGTDMELPDWRLGPNQLRQVSCPFWGLCAVGGDVGTVLTSSNPMAGKSAWFKSFVGDPADFNNGAGPSIDGLDCPEWWFCAATMWSGTIATTLDPPNPPVPWSFESTDGAFFSAISCSYEGSLCVAASREGSVVSALDGTSSDPTWGAPQPLAHEGLEEVSCAPHDAFCLVVDDEGFATIGTVGEGGTVRAVIPAEPSPPGPESPKNPLCKTKRAKGKRAGGLAIGGAIPLGRAPTAGRIGRSPCGSR
jgi:photosystem II stability/assembly factor-like uncharacterized protein